MKKIFILVFLVLSLSGCASYQALTSAPLMQASIKISVGRILENNPGWVEPTYKFTTTALSTLKVQDIISLGIVDDIFLEILREDLLPEEQDLALQIFTAIKQEVLKDLFNRGVIDPEDQKVYIIEALTWVNQSVYIRLEK